MPPVGLSPRFGQIISIINEHNSMPLGAYSERLIANLKQKYGEQLPIVSIENPYSETDTSGKAILADIPGTAPDATLYQAAIEAAEHCLSGQPSELRNQQVARIQDAFTYSNHKLSLEI